MIDQSKLAFVDTETTGLDPDAHQIWEVGLIVDEEEQRWFLPVDLGRADPIALRIGQFHERAPRDAATSGQLTYPGDFSREFAALTRGRHLVGAVISFDEERLRRLLKANGACPEWHDHLIDVEALAVGWLNGRYADPAWSAPAEWTGGPGAVDDARWLGPPWDSAIISKACGVDPDQFDKHTALGDARWAKAIYEAVMGGVVSNEIDGPVKTLSTTHHTFLSGPWPDAGDGAVHVVELDDPETVVLILKPCDVVPFVTALLCAHAGHAIKVDVTSLRDQGHRLTP